MQKLKIKNSDKVKMKTEKVGKIKILYEDKDILVIDKPAGVLVHGDGRNSSETIVDWFIKKYPKAIKVGDDIVLDNSSVIKRSGVVHRLDYETSGVLVLAKTRRSFSVLKEQFQNHSIKKIYNAFVYGTPKNPRGVIQKAIGRDHNDFRKKTTNRTMKGEEREAETTYIVLNSFKSYSFVKLIPKTGRTHQIRVHLKSIGHPVVCDQMYAGRTKNGLGFERVALHAKSIEFLNTDGQLIKVEADFPNDFKVAFEKLHIKIDLQKS